MDVLFRSDALDRIYNQIMNCNLFTTSLVVKIDNLSAIYQTLDIDNFNSDSDLPKGAQICVELPYKISNSNYLKAVLYAKYCKTKILINTF